MSADDAILPDAALDQHIAIIGRTGSGKTYTAKGFAERLLDAGRHVVIVDPTGVWWGLRSSANGQSPGFPVTVFGGRHADVPMLPGSGAVLGELIVQRRISCVIDVSEFTISARTPFLATLLEAFYSKCRSPLHLVLDEADIMAPQRPMPDQTLLLNRTEQIVRRGRARGLRTMLITQRPAVLHKDVLSQAGTLIAMKLTAPQDRNALGAWIDGQADREKGKAVLASLPRLLPGVGWVWWPEGDVLRETMFPRISTFDSSSTPEHGTVLEAPILAPVDIEDIRALLGAPEPKFPKGAAASIEKTLAFERARSTGVAEGRAESAVELAALRARVQQLNEAIDAVAKVLLAAQRNDDSASHNAAPARTAPAAADKPGVQGIAAQSPVGAAENRILCVLAHRSPAALTEAQWATLAGMKRTGGTWQTYKSRLKTRGLVIRAGNLWAATDSGLKVAGVAAQLPQTREQVLAVWRRSLGSGPGRMIDLLDAAPNGLSRSELAGAMGMAASGGTFQTYLSRLRSNDLVEADGAVFRLSAVLR